MNLSRVKQHLGQLEELKFFLPNGQLVPSHFHVTEVGQVTRNFIDCGGTLRSTQTVSMQLFVADDVDHRLAVNKLKDILTLSEQQLKLQDVDVEVEYQGVTIERYGLQLREQGFDLVPMQTDCLAKDKCGIPEKKPRVRLSDLQQPEPACIPGSGCC